MVHKEVDVRTKSARKNFGDDLNDSIEETNRPNSLTIEALFFLRNKSNQSIVETSDVQDSIIEFGK